MQSDPIKVGQLEIRYLIDGSAHTGMHDLYQESVGLQRNGPGQRAK